MYLTQETFERAVEHCFAQLTEHARGIDDQIEALGLDPEMIAALAEPLPWEGIDTPAGARSAAVALRVGILVGAQLRREGLLAGGHA
jgi:hypothetical protein